MTATATKRRPRRIAADEAHAWARNLKLANSLAKLVLCMLTGYVNGEGICFVGIESLADDTELSADTVRKRLAWLEQVGAIVRFPQWIDGNGRRNGDGHGKRTSDEIRLLINADPDEIEARAKGNGDGGSDAAPDEISPRSQQGLNPGQGLVSPLVALGQPSDSGKGLTSEPEPELDPPNPPSGGGHAIVADDESWKRFVAAWHFPITDLPKAVIVWQALTELEREDAITGAKGYRSYIDGEHRAKRNRAVKDAHRWLRDKLWLGYLDAGRTAQAVAERFDAPETSEEWNAWTVFYRCCGQSGIPSFLIVQTAAGARANVPQRWPPVGREFGELADWQNVYAGTGQFAAWLRRLRELKDVRIATRTVQHEGRSVQALNVPDEWPPNRGTTGPPWELSEQDRNEFTS